MNILFVTFYFKPDLCAGSFRSSAIVESLSKQLGENGSITVLTTMPNRYSSFTAEAQEFEKNGNVSVYRFPVKEHKSGFFDQSRSFYEYARRVMQATKEIEFDVVVATTSRFMTGVLGARIARKYKKSYFLDIRDIFSETLKELLSKKSKAVSFLVAPVLSFLEKYMIGRANTINIVSEGFRGYFKVRGFAADEWLFLPNGVDPEFIDIPDIKPVRDKVHVVYAGNIGSGQGLEKILPEVANTLNESHEFTIIGDGGTRMLLQERLVSLDVKNVQLRGPVGREQLIEYYRDADVLFLHLNDLEAFRRVLPSKIFEYAAMGKPVVAGVSGYASEFISRHIPYASIFHPCDAEGCIFALSNSTSIVVDAEKVQLFIEKFHRENIADQLASEILALSEDQS